ncbi:MAG: hypothetical protein CVV39_01325 [Planctomycetes bacterium HGW-Planctomycetes-1]|nr:MAG: hypothetical protein CVV39_01325 [Planctomycetes bacterium HGW-Planctomycetes-1]
MKKMNSRFEYKAFSNISGRVLAIHRGRIYVGYKNRLYVSADDGKTWQFAGVLPASRLCRYTGISRLCARLLRYEPRALAVSDNGYKLAATREGIYWADAQEIYFHSVQLPNLNRPVYFPMTILADSANRFLWGEYGSNPERQAVGIFVSSNGGKLHQLAYEFSAGDVRHIHGLYEDVDKKGFWVATGDKDKESGIGWLSSDLKDFSWLVRGNQKYRAVSIFVEKDCIIYATDTETDYNYIYRCDKNSGMVEKLAEIPGSCIYAAKFGNWYAVSTTVEKFYNFKTNMATLWLSQNGVDWKQIWECEKDIWPKKYFQYGSIVLPRSSWQHDKIVFSGQALKELDNRICIGQPF